MKPKHFFKILLITPIILLLFSCDSGGDGDNNNPSPNSREVKYELTGTVTGDNMNIQAIYFIANGDTASENFNSLPWTKTVTMQDDVLSFTFGIVVINATPGQTITAKYFVGGVLKQQATGTANADGTITLNLPSYVF